jgi:hypothetical protein
MLTEQRIRAFLFYLSVLIFLTGLPVILSSAFGYKFDRRTFKFTKTGLIFLKTQPAGASIFFNNKLLTDKTPATIRELLPGDYSIKLELEDHYSWAGEARVEPKKVALLDKIILFPRRPNIKHINKERFDSCWVDEEKGTVYYANYAENSVYSSDLDGMRNEKIADLLSISPPAAGWRVSPDREKLLYFNKHQIGITYLGSDRDKAVKKAPFIMEYSQGSIEDIFWHSDNYHLVVISDRSIEVLEAKLDSSPVELVKLNKAAARIFFNSREDTLYFIDSQKADDGKAYENLYKLELNARMLPFMELMKIKTNEQRQISE